MIILLIAYPAALAVLWRFRVAVRPVIRPYVPSALTLAWLAIMNVLDLCASPWCIRYGFPLEYRGWSDAQIIFKGVNLGIRAFKPTVLAADAVLSVLAALVVFRVARALEGRLAG
jgi:hypothetical protein